MKSLRGNVASGVDRVIDSGRNGWVMVVLSALAGILVVALVAALVYVFVLRDESPSTARYESADFPHRCHLPNLCWWRVQTPAPRFPVAPSRSRRGASRRSSSRSWLRDRMSPCVGTDRRCRREWHQQLS